MSKHFLCYSMTGCNLMTEYSHKKGLEYVLSIADFFESISYPFPKYMVRTVYEEERMVRIPTNDGREVFFDILLFGRRGYNHCYVEAKNYSINSLSNLRSEFYTFLGKVYDIIDEVQTRYGGNAHFLFICSAPFQEKCGDEVFQDVNKLRNLMKEIIKGEPENRKINLMAENIHVLVIPMSFLKLVDMAREVK